MSRYTYDISESLHSYNDNPAVISVFGYREWYKHGFLHRESDLPARIGARNHLEWWIEGRLHRDFGPAIVRSNGVISFYKNGLHIETLS